MNPIQQQNKQMQPKQYSPQSFNRDSPPPSSSSEYRTAGRGFQAQGMPIQRKQSQFKGCFKRFEVLTNYYPFVQLNSQKQSTNQTSQALFKYKIVFTPQVSDTAYDLRRKLINQSRASIGQQLDCKHFLFKNTFLLTNTPAQSGAQAKVQLDDQTYKIKVEYVTKIEAADLNQRMFYKAFFDRLSKGVKLVMIGNKFYDANNGIQLKTQNLSVMSGFSASVSMIQAGTFLKIDVSHRVLNYKNLMDQMIDIRQTSNDFQKECQKYINGKIVMTMYNNRCYKISRIDWNNSPSYEFQMGLAPGERGQRGKGQNQQSKSSSIAQYMKQKYNIQVRDMNQPLLVCEDQKTKKVFYLLPEFCSMTGLTDKHRSNFHLMRQMAQITNKRADQRVRCIQDFLNTVKRNCQETLKYWNLEISPHPRKVEAFQMHPGHLVMGDQKEINLTQTRNIDRQIQKPMYVQRKLAKWAIVYSSREEKAQSILIREFKNLCDQFKYPVDQPQVFRIEGPLNVWERQLDQISRQPDVNCIVIVLESKGMKKGLHYHQIKSLMNQRSDIPTQVVLGKTIMAGKNTKSIVSKILIQICAKIGGIPWGQKDMPFLDKPTMICSLDLFHKAGKTSILAFVATYEKSFGKYFSVVSPQGNRSQQAVDQLKNMMLQALQNFKVKNNIYPVNIILYRDGVGESQHKAIAQNEIQQILSAFDEVGGQDKFKLAYICVNKRIQTRIFNFQNQRIDSPPQGTLVNSDIVSYNEQHEKSDFYLISQTSNKGVPMPSHYVILYNKLDQSEQDLQLFTFRLCFLYYNVAGAISDPAPVRYAHRLSNVIGDAPNLYKPNDKLSDKLFFI